MQFDLWTLALQTVNFAILVWLLHRFLYKPVLAAIDARRSAIAKQYSDVDEAKTAVEAERAKVRQELEKIAAAARRDRAETDAVQLMNETRKKLARERDEAMEAARKHALDLGIEIAERLLDEIPADLRTEAWLERIEQHIGELGEKEREDIEKSLEQNKAFKVVTAAPLPQKAKTEWKKRIAKALGVDCEIGFESDPALIAGAELHFETAILRYSWRSVLDVARSEVGSSENTD